MKKGNFKNLAKRYGKPAIALLLVGVLLIQNAEPLLSLFGDMVSGIYRLVDMALPDALSSLHEAGIVVEDSINDKELDDDWDKNAYHRQPQMYYSEDEQLEELGVSKENLVHYDENSTTYVVGQNQYVTLLGKKSTYVDENGETHLIDNTLVETQIKALSGKKIDGVENRANEYTVRFPLAITTEEGIQVENDNYVMEVTPVAGNYRHSAVKENAILYTDVYDNTNVQYTVVDNTVKEDIVLYALPEKAVYQYVVNAPGMKMELVNNMLYIYPEDGSVENAVYILEAPVMEDAAGEYSTDIRLSLETKKGQQILTLTPDYDWLSDKDRQFPVRIDPTIVNIYQSSFTMIGVEQGSPNMYIGDNDYPYVGYDDGIASSNWEDFNTRHRTCRTYVAVTQGLEVIPQDSVIDSAYFYVSQRTAYSGGATYMGLYRVDTPWQVGITWNEQPGLHTFMDAQFASPARNTYVGFNVTTLVNDWVMGNYPNYGFVLKTVEEANSLLPNTQCEVLNNKNSTCGPYIVVEWSSKVDPFLAQYSINDTSINLRPMTEKTIEGLQQVDGVFVDGLATGCSTVEYYLTAGAIEGQHYVTEALGQYEYPDSSEFMPAFPNATIYNSNNSNWQSGLYYGLQTDIIYNIKAFAKIRTDEGTIVGQTNSSDSFLIYQVKQFDTLPRIAQHYGVPLATLMKDNGVQDSMVMAGNTLFIRNPQTAVPYNTTELSDLEKMKIDGALMGRGLHCEFGFEPININTGNFYMNQTDVTMNELGGEFTISRTYNSLAGDKNSMFGRGWSFDYDQGLYPMSDGSLVYKRGDGSFLFFTPKGNGTYSAPAGYTYTLTTTTYTTLAEDGSTVKEKGWLITDADQTRYTFDKYGLLMNIVDAYGFTTTLSYDENYNLNKITTPSGKVYEIVLNARGYVHAITQPDGSNIVYDYDAVGNLTGVTNQNGKTRTYQYDANHQMTSWKDENGNTVVSNVYDAQGRVVKQTDANGGIVTLSYGAGTTTTVDAEGNKTIYQYDSLYRTTSITYPDGSTVKKTYNSNNQLATETTANGTKSYTYDKFGNIATEKREDGKTASYTYNNQNKLTSVTDFGGGKVTYSYDSAGNMVSSTQADGNKVTCTYDTLHRLISQKDGRGVVTSYSYDGANLIAIVDGEGGKWTFTYDAMNRQTSATDPLGNTTSVTYDRVGNKTSEIAADGGRTTYKLDAVGNILATTDERGYTTTFTYDKLYNILKVTDADGKTTSYQYNKNNQEIKATDALGNTITYTRDSMGRVVKETSKTAGTKIYEYDLAGNLIKVTDGKGNVTTSTYDTQGNVTKITDALGNDTKYTYDAMGNETKVIYADGSTVTKAYDTSGRLVKEINEAGVVTTYTYDANGNLLSVSEDGERTYTYEYNKNNRKVKEINPEGGVCTFAYDAAGRMISTTDENGNTTRYTYDAAGRVTSVKDALDKVTKTTYDIAGNVTSTTDAKGNVTTYTYDKFGNLTSITDPLGNITAMKYNAVGQLYQTMDSLKGTTTYEYDGAGNVIKMTDALGNVYTYTYDKNGNNTSITGPDNARTTMKYDALDRLISITDPKGLTITYTYDKVGRVTIQKDNAGNALYYTYDKAGNIISEKDQLGRTTTYTYDKYGNLLTETAPDASTTTYEYDIMNRVSAVTDAAGTRTEFTYDKAGNQLTLKEADGAKYSYTYDGLNRVVSITNPLGAKEKYQYDANGNVTAYTDANGNVTRYTYDKNNNTISVTDGTGAITNYTYDQLGRLIKETAPEGEVKEYRYDALGNLSRYKDAEGGITQYEYDALGNMVKTISPKGEKTTYTYDMHGNVLTETDTAGNVTTYEYNANDQVTKLVQANGGAYTYEYDKVGRLTKTTSPLGFSTSFTYDVMDNVVEETNSLGQTTTYTYDVLGRMTGSIDAKGGSSVYAYDFRNNLISETDASGFTTTYTYDVLSRMVAEKDPLGYITEYTYDPVGNLKTVLEPGGATTSYSYDANANVTGVTDPLGYTTSYAYDKSSRMSVVTDALGQTYTYGYNKNGQVTAETDKAGNTTTYTYDLHGNMLSVTDAVSYTTNYSYDSLDNLKKVVTAGGSTASYTYDNMGNMLTYTSALGNTTTYTYDLEGNQTSRTDATGRTETYVYDAAGRMTSLITASGDVITYDYDALNQLLEKAYKNANGETTEDSVLYGYDASGNRISMTDSIGAASYVYDAVGQIISTTDSAGQTVAYAYDGRGNVTEITYPDGTKVTYTYDLNDNLTSVTDRSGKTTTYAYDALNRLTATYRPNFLATYVTYDALDHITKLETVHMVTGRLMASYEYTYNEAGYVTQEIVKETVLNEGFEELYDMFLDTILGSVDLNNYQHVLNAWKNFYDAQHTYCDHNDADGDGNYDDCKWAFLTATTTYNYRYDANWQLTNCTETLQNGSKTEYDYLYDTDGNRTKYVKTVNGEAVECYTYQYNASNQLVSRTNERLWTDNVTNYTYDADGNLISEQTGGYTKTYEYTAENRLAVVRAQGTILMAALYDGDGNRLFTMDYTGENNDRWDIWIPECGGNAHEVDDSAKDAMKSLAFMVSGHERKDYTITEYVNDITRENEEVLVEINHRGRITTSYTYGTSRESVTTASDTQYYLYDGQGNVSRMSSEWGRIKETYTYDPYGNLTYGIPDTVNYYGYNGESANLATGLQYLRARYYNPRTGSFITEDTYAGQATNPLSLNRYDYVSNNPLNYNDPSGHSAFSKWASNAWDSVTGFFGDVYDAYNRGYQIQQQNQQYETEIINNLLSETYEKIRDVNKAKDEYNQKITEIQTGQIVGTIESVVQKQNAVEQQCQQAEAEVQREYCEYLEEHSTEVKFAIGGTVIAATGVTTVLTSGATAQSFLGATIGGVVGGFLHYIFAESEATAVDEAADGFMWGTITGAACSSISSLLTDLGKTITVLQNTGVFAVLESLLETAVEELAIILQGGNVSIESVGADFFLNIFTSGETPHMQAMSEGLEIIIKQLRNWFDDTLQSAKVALGDIGQSIVTAFRTHSDDVVEGGSNSAKYSNWDEMKNAYDGTITKFINENKPKYSPDIKKWFDNGGTIEIGDVDGKKIWTYTSVTGESVPYIDGYIQFPDEYLNPTIKSIDIGEFTGDRGKDIDKMLEILEADYGITEIPDGYVVHHDIENGILQLVDENIHKMFTHIGGHSLYK